MDFTSDTNIFPNSMNVIQVCSLPVYQPLIKTSKVVFNERLQNITLKSRVIVRKRKEIDGVLNGVPTIDLINSLQLVTTSIKGYNINKHNHEESSFINDTLNLPYLSNLSLNEINEDVTHIEEDTVLNFERNSLYVKLNSVIYLNKSMTNLIKSKKENMLLLNEKCDKLRGDRAVIMRYLCIEDECASEKDEEHVLSSYEMDIDICQKNVNNEGRKLQPIYLQLLNTFKPKYLTFEFRKKYLEDIVGIVELLRGLKMEVLKLVNNYIFLQKMIKSKYDFEIKTVNLNQDEESGLEGNLNQIEKQILALESNLIDIEKRSRFLRIQLDKNVTQKLKLLYFENEMKMIKKEYNELKVDVENNFRILFKNFTLISDNLRLIENKICIPIKNCNDTLNKRKYLLNALEIKRQEQIYLEAKSIEKTSEIVKLSEEIDKHEQSILKNNSIISNLKDLSYSYKENIIPVSSVYDSTEAQKVTVLKSRIVEKDFEIHSIQIMTKELKEKIETILKINNLKGILQKEGERFNELQLLIQKLLYSKRFEKLVEDKKGPDHYKNTRHNFPKKRRNSSATPCKIKVVKTPTGKQFRVKQIKGSLSNSPILRNSLKSKSYVKKALCFK